MGLAHGNHRLTLSPISVRALNHITNVGNRLEVASCGVRSNAISINSHAYKHILGLGVKTLKEDIAINEGVIGICGIVNIRSTSILNDVLTSLLRSATILLLPLSIVKSAVDVTVAYSAIARHSDKSVINLVVYKREGNLKLVVNEVLCGVLLLEYLTNLTIGIDSNSEECYLLAGLSTLIACLYGLVRDNLSTLRKEHLKNVAVIGVCSSHIRGHSIVEYHNMLAIGTKLHIDRLILDNRLTNDLYSEVTTLGEALSREWPVKHIILKDYARVVLCDIPEYILGVVVQLLRRAQKLKQRT